MNKEKASFSAQNALKEGVTTRYHLCFAEKAALASKELLTG